MDFLIQIDCSNDIMSNSYLNEYLERHNNFIRGLKENIKIEIDKHGTIDFSKIFSKNFPILNNYDVFISYSHADLEHAVHIANEIEKNTRYKCFIDELYWASIRDVIDELSNVNSKQSTNSHEEKSIIEEWSKIGFSAELLKIISKCSYFVFVKTTNSVNKDGNIDYKTSSPWLYFENSCANVLYVEPVCHSKKESYNFTIPSITPSYKLDLDKYEKLTLNEFIYKLKYELF